jgi:hypothetical protein
MDTETIKKGVLQEITPAEREAETSTDSDFPIHIFPPSEQLLIKELDKNCSYPAAVTSAAILSAAGMAMGNFVQLYHKQEWIEAACLYMAIVGAKGTGKTHPVTTIYKPLVNLEKEEFETYTKQLASWQSKRDEARIEKQAFDEAAPTWKRYVVDNTTIEKLAEILNENPRGLSMVNDELRAWFKSFTQYDSDSLDKWLRIFNRGRIVVDRMSRGTTQINSPFVSVIGTIQPEVLERLITNDFRECGLLDRMLFVTIDDKLKYNENDIDEKLINDWSDTIKMLLNLAPTKPRYIYFSGAARTAFTKWKQKQIEFLNENDTERNLGGKWDNYILRFSLILHCLHEGDQAFISEVSLVTFERAEALCRYFQDQYFKLLGDKDSYLVRQFNEVKRKVYEALPGTFVSSHGVLIAKEYDMKERTFRRWLNERQCFKFLKHGSYEKLLEL